jgi:hypothetical protein
MISEDTTNAVRRKVVVSLFEQPIPRLPELTAFAWLHRREFFKVATDRVDEYRYHQAFQALQFRAGAASSPTNPIDARISRSVLTTSKTPVHCPGSPIAPLLAPYVR